MELFFLLRGSWKDTTIQFGGSKVVTIGFMKISIFRMKFFVLDVMADSCFFWKNMWVLLGNYGGLKKWRFPDVCIVHTCPYCPSLKFWRCCSSRTWSEVLSKHDFDFMLVGFNKGSVWSTHMQLHKRSKTTTEKWLRKVTDIHVPWILTSLNAKQKSSDLNIQLRLDSPPTCCRWHYSKVGANSPGLSHLNSSEQRTRIPGKQNDVFWILNPQNMLFSPMPGVSKLRDMLSIFFDVNCWSL